MGKRYVKVTQQRTRKDWTVAMKELPDGYYPDADRIVVVSHNLKAHSPASFYEAFASEEARRLVKRFELPYTPQRGSWLNMAEIELSVLNCPCLDRRIPDRDLLKRETKAWEDDRNAEVVKVLWRFTTADARIKLRHSYPQIEP